MTKKQAAILDEYVKRVEELGSYGDNESAHASADALLLEAVRKLGFGQLADAWDGVKQDVGGFWYA